MRHVQKIHNTLKYAQRTYKTSYNTILHTYDSCIDVQCDDDGLASLDDDGARGSLHTYIIIMHIQEQRRHTCMNTQIQRRHTYSNSVYTWVKPRHTYMITMCTFKYNDRYKNSLDTHLQGP